MGILIFLPFHQAHLDTDTGAGCGKRPGVRPSPGAASWKVRPSGDFTTRPANSWLAAAVAVSRCARFHVTGLQDLADARQNGQKRAFASILGHWTSTVYSGVQGSPRQSRHLFPLVQAWLCWPALSVRYLSVRGLMHVTAGWQPALRPVRGNLARGLFHKKLRWLKVNQGELRWIKAFSNIFIFRKCQKAEKSVQPALPQFDELSFQRKTVCNCFTMKGLQLKSLLAPQTLSKSVAVIAIRLVRRVQKVEKMIWLMRGVRLCSPFLGRLRPGLERPQIRLRVKAGGHNNTQLNPVFRGMVRRLTGAG
jgi:hypothetical protein